MRLALLLSLGLIVAAPNPARAQGIWLALVVDVSASIDDGEYRLQRTGYVRALTDPDVQRALRDTRVAIIEFSNEARVIVDWTTADRAAHLYQQARGRIKGNTNVRAGLDAALDMLEGREGLGIVDISADGTQNGDNGCSHFAPGVAAARERLVQVNALVIEGEYNECEYGGLSVGYWYRDQLLGVGFVVQVEGWRDFQQMLKRKLRLEVAAALDTRRDG